MDKVSIKPNSGRVIFQPIERKSAIILAETDDKKESSKYLPCQGTVVITSDETVKPFAKVGDRIFFNPNAFDPLEIEGEQPYYIMNDGDILAILS